MNDPGPLDSEDTPIRPADLVGRPLPELALLDPAGAPFPLRGHVGKGPLVLFFYIRNGTPGWIFEQREFRARYAAFAARVITVAGVSRDTVESNRSWARRLALPYPLLSDPDGSAGRAVGVVRRVGFGPWKVDLFRRTTFLIDDAGVVAAEWGDVKVRRHARDVLAHADALMRDGASGGPRPAT